MGCVIPHVGDILGANRQKINLTQTLLRHRQNNIHKPSFGQKGLAVPRKATPLLQQRHPL